jgi:hypothetical protein
MQLTLKQPNSGYTTTVSPMHRSVYLLMALLVISTPLIACALPGEEMTKEEQDCCLQMSDRCGSQMSDAHTCCTKTPHVEGTNLKVSSKYTPAAPEVVQQPALCDVAPAVAASLPRLQNTPDGSPSPPRSISVLRI